MNHLFSALSMPLRMLLWVLLVAISPISYTVAQAPTEQELTVAFIFNFLKFVEWPQGSVDEYLNLCVTEANSLAKELDQVAGHLAQNKPVQIKHLVWGGHVDDCQLLFIAREEKPARVQDWIKAAKTTPVLLVSNSPDFLDQGGMIELVSDDTRLHFEINFPPIKAVNLKLSSHLLKIAREVRGLHHDE